MATTHRLLTAICLVATSVHTAALPEDGGATGDPAATGAEVERLVEQLKADDFEQRQEAVGRLIEIGEPALAAVERLAADPSPDVGILARQVLEAIGRQLSGAIDLDPKANRSLDQKFGTLAGNTLKTLPRGVQKLGGIDFHIGDKALVLGSDRAPGLPKAIEGIAVGRQCGQLHMLQALIFGAKHGLKDGDLVAKYVVHYDDDTKVEIPVEAGADVRDWWDDDGSRPVTRGKVVWEGNNPAAARWGHSLRLYAGSWENPHPEKRVVTIDYLATHKTAAPFCIAITADKAAPEPAADGD